VDREQVLAEIRRRVEAGGGKFVQTVKSLAQELGVKTDRLYNLIRSFESKGEIHTVGHGPRGTEFRLGPPRPAEARGPRRAAAGEGRGTRFCPWCGQRLDAQWRFCPACGRPVPAAR
jgi:hypothetical protein